MQVIEKVKVVPEGYNGAEMDGYDFTIPLVGDGNISRGNVTLSIPFINKGIVFNQSDLETFRQLLIQE